MEFNVKVVVKFLIPAMCIGIAGIIQHAANADALWAQIDGNELQVRLSDAPDNDSIQSDKIQKSIITAGRQNLALQQNEKPYLTTTLPPSTDLVGVSNDWGKIQSNEPGGGEYHLHYYAKAARTLADAADPTAQKAQWYVRYQYGAPPGVYWNQGDKPSIPLVARLVENGHPVAHAQVKVYNPRNQQYRFKYKSFNSVFQKELYSTDNEGKVLFYAEGDGDYKLYASWMRQVRSPKSNTFTQVRNYATITLHVRAVDIEGFDRAAKVNTNNNPRFISHTFSMRFSPDGKKLITVGPITKGDDELFPTITDKRLRVWDVASGKEIWRLPAQPYSPTTMENFWARNKDIVMPDFKTMYTSQWNKYGFTNIDIHSFRRGKKFEVDTHAISHITLSPNGEFLAVGTTGVVHIVDAKTLQTLRSYGHGGQGAEVFWGPHAKTLIMEASGGRPQAIDVATAKQIHYPRWFYRVRGSDAFAFSSDGNYLAKANGHTVEIWETPTATSAGAKLNTFTTKIDLVRVLQFSPDGKTLAVGGSSKTEVPVQFIKLSQVRK